MTEKEKDVRVSWLQYINTGMLTLICGFSIMAASTLTTVKDEQKKIGNELIRMQTIQDGEVVKLKELTSRVYSMEYNSESLIKSWVDLNYVRRPQK